MKMVRVPTPVPTRNKDPSGIASCSCGSGGAPLWFASGFDSIREGFCIS